MTRDEFAKLIDGREYGDELSRDEEKLAKESGLVVVFGASDDLVEVRGCIHDEVGAWRGAELRFIEGGLLPEHHCDCDFCSYKLKAAAAKAVIAIWDGPDAVATWTFATNIQHAKFMIYEDGEPFCQGLVFEHKEIQ